VELYNFQQQLAHLQKELEKTEIATQELEAERARDEERIAALSREAGKEASLAEENEAKVRSLRMWFRSPWYIRDASCITCSTLSPAHS
jgi:septal ring factor EnvC (AmiA/AmiB activator)